MAKFPSTYAVDTGKKLSEKFFDIRWMATSGVVPIQRWYTHDEQLPQGDEEPSLWGYGAVDKDNHLVVNYFRKEVFGSLSNTPKMWFVLLDGGPLGEDTRTMFGFADDRYPLGTVVEMDEIKKSVEKDYLLTWAGMVIWGKGEPVLHQITTAEKWRRKRISVMMLGICDVVNGCYGFTPGRVLHGGAVTTEDGEKLREIYAGVNTRIDARTGSVRDIPEENII